MTQSIDNGPAVVLSGGGAYAAYEVGVMKALFSGESPASAYAPVDARVFTGTSAGAVNAAMLVSTPDEDLVSSIRRLEHIWTNVISETPQRCGNGVFRFRGNLLRYLDARCIAANPTHPFTELAEDSAFFARDWFNRGIDFLSSSGSLESRTLELLDLSSFISSESFKVMIKEVLSLADIRRSPRVLKVVATNWETGEVRIFGNADMQDDVGHKAILASAAVPGVFQPQYIEGDPYVDGSLVMSTPLKCAIEAGACTLHVIYLDPDVKKIPFRTLQSTLDTLDRALTINFAIKTNEDVATAAWINEGLDAIERIKTKGAVSDADLRAFVRVASQVEKRLRQGKPYRSLTIHLYHPSDDLGGGPLGLLNFDRERMIDLVAKGFVDAVSHDCERSQCILPGASRE
jgi:predicted acylesterase/phospholipase RssA